MCVCDQRWGNEGRQSRVVVYEGAEKNGRNGRRQSERMAERQVGEGEGKGELKKKVN